MQLHMERINSIQLLHLIQFLNLIILGFFCLNTRKISPARIIGRWASKNNSGCLRRIFPMRLVALLSLAHSLSSLPSIVVWGLASITAFLFTLVGGGVSCMGWQRKRSSSLGCCSCNIGSSLCEGHFRQLSQEDNGLTHNPSQDCHIWYNLAFYWKSLQRECNYRWQMKLWT